MQEKLAFILQAMQQQNNSIEQATQLYNNMLLEDAEALAYQHFGFIESDNDFFRNSSLVLLSRYFTEIEEKQIPLSETCSTVIQKKLLSLFLNEKLNISYVSYVVSRAAIYFKNNWPDLLSSLCNLISNPNPFISSSVVQCISDCIHIDTFDVNPYYEFLINYIKNYLSAPSDSMPITITSNLRLFYSLVDCVDPEMQESIFLPFMNGIVNFMTILPDNPTLINDFYFFYRVHLNLLSESYLKYYEALMSIISNPNFCYGNRSSAIYTLLSIISRYPEGFQSLCISLFDFFSKMLIDDEAFEDASVFLSGLSEIYGGNPQYAQFLYEYIKNHPNIYAIASFGLSYNGIKDHFININISKELFETYLQEFTSKDPKCRQLFLYSFSPLVSIFHKTESNFPAEASISIILNAIKKEDNYDILTLEIQMLSQILKYYSIQLQQKIPEIINCLDSLLVKHNQQNIIIYLIKCYKHIAISFKEQIIPLSGPIAIFISQCLSNPQKSNDLFFYCMEELPYFKYSFPQEIFNRLMSFLFQFLIQSFDNNGNLIANDKDGGNFFDGADTYLMKFFLRSLENDTIIKSPDLFQRIIKISFNTIDDDSRFEKVSDPNIDISECCEIIQLPNEDACIVISNDQMSLFRNSMSVLFLIFQTNPQLLQFNYTSLYQLLIVLLQLQLCTHLFSNIFDLEILILPFIQNEGQFMNLLDKTLKKEFIYEYNLLDMQKLSQLLIAYIHFTKNRFNENTVIILTIMDFIMNLFVFLDVQNNDKKESAIKLNNITYNDKKYLPVKISFSLIFRVLFQFYPSLSQQFFLKGAMDLLFSIQKDNETNKIIAAIIFSDYILSFPLENDNHLMTFVELFKSYLQSQDHQIILSGIYGLSVILNPSNTNVESIQQIIQIFSQYVQSNFNSESCSMLLFAFLQLFQNYSSVFDVSIYFPQFWQLVNGETFHLQQYCIDNFSQSLLSFALKFGNQIPNDKLPDLKIIIQKLLNQNVNNPLTEPLNSLLMKLSS